MTAMTSVHDVAAFILAELGQMGTMKLQKLVYYSQAWSLVWDRQPVFSEPIEAWENGPVVRDLYRQHRAMPFIERLDRGDPSRLSDDQRASIAAVLHFYGERSGSWLSELTHRESPWLEARAAAAGASTPPISLSAMRDFFSLYPAQFRSIPASIARGLELVVGLPRDVVDELFQGSTTDATGIEEWLMTGEGDPWQASAG